MKIEKDIFNQYLSGTERHPEISVLVPVYNVELYLEQCLDSLTSQTFKNIEIICVDDGSTDMSGDILDQYAVSDSRIKVIHKENTGYGNSMNVAMEHATGNYIAILESDDFAEPDMLQRLYETAKIHKVDVVKGTYYNYRNGKDIRSDRVDDYPKGMVLNCILYPAILRLPDTIWSCLYSHSFLLEHKICFHETPGASYQDISFALQVWFWAERVLFIEDPLLHYRRDNPTSSMNNPSKLFCVFDEYKWSEEKLEDILKDSLVLRQYFTATKYCDYLSHYRRVGVQYQYALLVRLEQSLLEDRKKGWIDESAFIPTIWEQIHEIEIDRNQFFKKTARPTPDARPIACNVKNRQVYEEAFFETLKIYPKIFIYGAGQVGKRLAKSIQQRGGKVDAFLVTKITKEDSMCMGIPIIQVQEAVPMADSCGVVIAVTEWSQYELYGILEKYGFCHIFRTDEVVRKSFCS